MEQARPIREAVVSFTGTRRELFGILLRGTLLMLPTLGIYRFWLVTWKRRFYWSHTEIDGDPLEYTGTAKQLLIGFLIAVAIFLPIYGYLFYLGTVSPGIAAAGYIGAAVLLYFLAGYAIYRARRFRLTRTFWRGIRMHQSGGAWNYAIRRFLWTLLMIVTLGLAYPFMAADLWRYRYSNTWFGDRKFSFAGTWKTIAGPFYGIYVLVIVLAVAALVTTGGVFAIAAGLAVPLGYVFVTSRETSRFLSSVSAGDARLRVRVRARDLLLQHLTNGLALGLVTIGFLVLGLLIIATAAGASIDFDNPELLRQVAGLGPVVLAAIILSYMALLACYSICSELVLAFGFWKIVARGATIEDADSLALVRAAGDESPLAGEGLADALNVGAY